VALQPITSIRLWRRFDETERPMRTLPIEKKRAVLNALLEGNSIRATERLTGVTKKAIMRLLVLAGEHCAAVLDNRMRDVRCAAIEADEIWSFVGKKQNRLNEEERKSTELGDQYTFVAFDPDSKLVPVFYVGRRNVESARLFVSQIRDRVIGRIQLSTDGWRAYWPAVDEAFAGDVDYAQIDKHYVQDPMGLGRYSPPKVQSTTIVEICGTPDPRRICTSYVERNNLTIRMQTRRFTRLTNGFSRKLRNLKAAVALFFAHYNLCRVHGSIRMTPAMAAGISDHIWSLDELLSFRIS
jgi:IS1 family transposase